MAALWVFVQQNGDGPSVGGLELLTMARTLGRSPRSTLGPARARMSSVITARPAYSRWTPAIVFRPPRWLRRSQNG